MSHAFSHDEYQLPRPSEWSTCSNSDLKNFYMKTGYLNQCLKTPEPSIQKGEIIHDAEFYQNELFNPTSPPPPYQNIAIMATFFICLKR